MLVNLHEKALFISFQLYICFISLFYFIFVHVLTVSYNMYKTLKMPAHWCIYKLMLYIHFIKYLFYISKYKAILIQLLICHIYIYIYIYIYIKQKVPIRIPLSTESISSIGKSSNTVKTLTIPIPNHYTVLWNKFRNMTKRKSLMSSFFSPFTSFSI